MHECTSILHQNQSFWTSSRYKLHERKNHQSVFNGLGKKNQSRLLKTRHSNPTSCCRGGTSFVLSRSEHGQTIICFQPLERGTVLVALTIAMLFPFNRIWSSFVILLPSVVISLQVEGTSQ
jgi:hypothetical protein